MLNIVWPLMIIAGFVFAAVTGRVEETSQAMLGSGGEAIKLCLGMAGAFALWNGLLHVASGAGLTERFAALLNPLLKRLFPTAASDKKAISATAMNLAADFLGLGGAATPFGLEACRRMRELNAQDDAVTLVALNSASVQMIPVTVLAMRTAAGSARPAAVVLPAALCALISMAAALLVAVPHRKKRL